MLGPLALLKRYEVFVVLYAYLTLEYRCSKILEELVPGIFLLGVVQKVLQNLVREGVSICDLLSIVECLADYGPSMKDADQLTEFVRQRLARTIIRPYLGF